MRKVIRTAAFSVMAFSLLTGVAAASTGTIGTTGPDSTNKVSFKSRDYRRVNNNNNVNVNNTNPQTASTGDAQVRHNTTGGNAASGHATNDSLLRANVGVSNASSSSAAMAGLGGGSHTGTINNTGPDSYNSVRFSQKSKVKVENNNNVNVNNTVSQTATSGDAKVKGNTTGGSASSGNASNISTTETTINITN